MRAEPRRRGPRTMATVMDGVIADLAPTDPLGRLQTAWPQLVGRKHAAGSKPVRLQGDGTMVISCDSGALASELGLRTVQIQALMEELLELRCDLRFQGPAGRRG